MTITIGVIGAGRIGRAHIEAMHLGVPGVRVGAVCGRSGDKAKALADEYGIACYTNDYRDVVHDPAIQAVAVCSHTESHVAIVTEAARAGKHIFCEKPLALTLDEVDRALAAVDEAGVMFMLGFNHRYDAGNMRIRQAVAGGEIGRPEMLFITNRDPDLQDLDYLRHSGGIFVDTVSHDFDLSRYLLDDEPEEIYARGECNVDPAVATFGDYDTVMAMARFRRGTLVHYNASRRALYGYDQRVEAFGSLGRIETRNLPEDNTVIATADGYRRPPDRHFFMERYAAAYREEGRVFAQCLKDNRPPPSGGRDGRMAMLMGMAALRSARENRTVRMDEVG